MQLKLCRLDLKSEYEDIACRLTKFEHFKPEVQDAIQLAGRAIFIINEGSRRENYNVIYSTNTEV